MEVSDFIALFAVLVAAYAAFDTRWERSKRERRERDERLERERRLVTKLLRFLGFHRVITDERTVDYHSDRDACVQAVFVIRHRLEGDIQDLEELNSEPSTASALHLMHQACLTFLSAVRTDQVSDTDNQQGDWLPHLYAFQSAIKKEGDWLYDHYEVRPLQKERWSPREGAPL
jgi:hypothetical protein